MEGNATVAPFRAWRGSHCLHCRGPVGPLYSQDNAKKMARRQILPNGMYNYKNGWNQEFFSECCLHFAWYRDGLWAV